MNKRRNRDIKEIEHLLAQIKEYLRKVYYQKWFVVLMLFVFAPIGITLL